MRILGLIYLVYFSYVRSNFLTLRVKQTNGMISRILIDEVNSTLSDLSRMIKQVINVSDADNVVFTNFNTTFTSLLSNKTTLSQLSIKNGEIISLFCNNLRNTSTISRRIISNKSKVPISTHLKKYSMSIADIEKHRGKLIKIKRQKANTSTIVRLSSSSERILTRLMTSGGGIALLIGKHTDNRHSVKNKKKSKVTSSSIISKDDECLKYIDIEGLIELSIGNFSVNSGLIDEIGTFISKKASNLANNIGLEVIGCCIAFNNSERSSWSSLHVHLALQLLPFSTSKKDFVILSVSSKNYTSKASRDRKLILHKNESTSTISLEAYRFTDQAILLYQKDILPAKSLIIAVNSSTITQCIPATNITRKKSKFHPTTRLNIINEDCAVPKDMIKLTGPVIFRNSEEVNELDAIILSVPLPIIHFSSSSTYYSLDNNNPESTVKVFEDHIFPTLYELQDGNIAQTATRYLLKLLKNIHKNENLTVRRLRDPHLLLYLSTLIEEDVFQSLCDYLNPNRCPQMNKQNAMLSESVKLGLSMVQLSLEHALNDNESS